MTDPNEYQDEQVETGATEPDEHSTAAEDGANPSADADAQDGNVEAEESESRHPI